MAEDQGKEEEKFDFTREGEAVGYISLAQARLLAIQTAGETLGNYGSQHQDVPMVFEAVEAIEEEDYYVVTLSVRPQGDFSGSPGQEQFFIEKEGTVAVRQVLRLPRQRGGFPLLPVAIGLIVVGVIAAVGAVFALGSTGGDGAPVALVIPTETPVPTVAPTSTTEPAAIPATDVPTRDADLEREAEAPPRPSPTLTLLEAFRKEWGTEQDPRVLPVTPKATATPRPTYTPRPIPTARVIVVTPTPTRTPLLPSASSYFDKARDYVEDRMYRLAIDEFTKAIQLDPDYALAYIHRGVAYGSHMGQWQQAIEDFDKVIQLNPYYTWAYNSRGIAYGRLGQYQRAIEDYDKAIQLDPDYAGHYHNRGRAYRALGQYTLADADKAKACSMDSQFC